MMKEDVGAPLIAVKHEEVMDGVLRQQTNVFLERRFNRISLAEFICAKRSFFDMFECQMLKPLK
jgi:hypothetical protein